MSGGKWKAFAEFHNKSLLNRPSVAGIPPPMNKLYSGKRVQILHRLVEGNSMQAAARIAEVSFNSVKPQDHRHRLRMSRPNNIEMRD